MLNIIIVPVLTFFIVKYNPVFIKWISSVVPKNIYNTLLKSTNTIDSTLRSLIKGQCFVAFCLGVLYLIGFYSIGLQSAFVIAIIAGFCRIIPYMDIVVGGGLSLISCLYNFISWNQIFLVALIFVIVQSIDGLFITPKVIGKKAGLHPIVVILSIISFGDMFGIWGVILAVPIVAVVKDIVNIALPSYLHSNFYNED